MNTAFSITNTSFSYSGKPVFRDISLECEEGVWLAIVGRNGSGKSTLLKFLNALLVPEQGFCRVFGLDTSAPENAIEIRKRAPMVFQNPESQIVGVTVEDDAAFALENLCVPSDEIERRVERALAETGLLHARKNLVHTLSGGEKQRLALAGAIAQAGDFSGGSPKMFLLDEATSMLDPEGREAMLEIFRGLHAQGNTIVQVTHDFDEIGFADRVFDIGGWSSGENDVVQRERKKTCENAKRETVSSLSHTYSDGVVENCVFRDVSFEFARGEIISLVGRTGSGKSTLVQYLNALFLSEKNCGEVFLDGENVKKNPRAVRRRVGMVFQNPEQQLFAQTVREELCFALENWEFPKELHEEMARDALRQVFSQESAEFYAELLERSPLELSGGEMRRVAIASILVYKPEWLVLDEPSAGLDADGRAELAELLFNLREQGTGVFVVTHDIKFARANSDRLFELKDGHLSIYTSQPNSISP